MDTGVGVGEDLWLDCTYEAAHLHYYHDMRANFMDGVGLQIPLGFSMSLFIRGFLAPVSRHCQTPGSGLLKNNTISLEFPYTQSPASPSFRTGALMPVDPSCDAITSTF